MVLFEPNYPTYLEHLQICGGKLKQVPLEVDADNKWVFDTKKLKKVLSKKTRLLILNTPQNPTGKCFSREEYELISEILDDYPDCIVLADEVYDFLTFDNA